jgi:hypothetical protein
MDIIASSEFIDKNTRYALVWHDGAKWLLVEGDVAGFVDNHPHQPMLYPLNAQNAKVLRSRLMWLNPQALGTRTSAGFGDRLGIATHGHIASVVGTGVAPIFAQQSVRENTRTGRTPQIVVDDAMWGVFECGWREAWGADADHIKTIADIQPFVEAGYTFFTIDPSAHVDDSADADSLDILRGKAPKLDWQTLNASPEKTVMAYCESFTLDDRVIQFDETTIFRAMAKYGDAVAHTVKLARYLAGQFGDKPFDLEISVDETETTTSLHEHFYIASELKRLGITWVSMAPRFVGRFEKGVDYIGDLDELEANIAGHAAIIRYFGDVYKLSLHTGSDKFGVYPIAMRHTNGLVHLKTAGTSYLEALRVMARIDPDLFRKVLDFARERYDNDRKTYHVSAVLDKVPPSGALSDDELPDLLNQFDARQVLHVTFGSVLDTFGGELKTLLQANLGAYHAGIKAHFDRHIAPLTQGENAHV